MKRLLYLLAGLAFLWVGEWFRHRMGCYGWPRPWYDLPSMMAEIVGLCVCLAAAIVGEPPE